MRPAEKLYEELLIGDNPESTIHPRIMKAYEKFTLWEDLQDQLKTLELALRVNDIGAIRSIMKRLVAEYEPSEEIVDWVFIQQQSEIPVAGFVK